MSGDRKTGIYIHWPFCKSKCPYCDFNSHVREGIDEHAWENAYVKALESYAVQLPEREIVSVFFGGGTPSLMPPRIVESILSVIQKNWSMAEDIEVTLEANPTSVESGKLKAFRQAGVNRVSLGIQALNDNDLKFLGRQHDSHEALEALDIAKSIFDRFSFDLIYARPEQDLKQWEVELKQAIQYSGGHLSLYQLTIERNTPFYMDHIQGKFAMPTENLAADFYNLTQDVLSAGGLPAYEISNHAQPGQESRHNMIYWRYNDYIGVGPGAHGRLTMEGQKFATREHSAPEIWLEKAEHSGAAAHPYELLSRRDRFLEALMMGLRLEEGVSLQRLEAEGDAPLDRFLDRSKMQDLQGQGWLSVSSEHLRLEREGLLRLNAVIPYILKQD